MSSSLEKARGGGGVDWPCGPSPRGLTLPWPPPSLLIHPLSRSGLLPKSPGVAAVCRGQRPHLEHMLFTELVAQSQALAPLIPPKPCPYC